MSSDLLRSGSSLSCVAQPLVCREASSALRSGVGPRADNLRSSARPRLVRGALRRRRLPRRLARSTTPTTPPTSSRSTRRVPIVVDLPLLPHTRPWACSSPGSPRQHAQHKLVVSVTPRGSGRRRFHSVITTSFIYNISCLLFLPACSSATMAEASQQLGGEPEVIQSGLREFVNGGAESERRKAMPTHVHDFGCKMREEITKYAERAPSRTSDATT